MDESRWERYGAGAGVGFVVLLILSGFVAPTMPDIEDSAAKISAYYADHTRAILTGGVFGLFAAVLFLWFITHLRHVTSRAEGGAEAISPMVYASGVALVAVAVMQGMPGMTLAYMAHRGDAVSAGTTRMLFDMAWMGNNFVAVMAGLFLVSASLAVLRREMVAPWLGWAGMVVAAVSFVGGAAGFYVTESSGFWMALGMVGFLGFAAWVLVASVVMLQRPEVMRAEAHAPVFSH